MTSSQRPLFSNFFLDGHQKVQSKRKNRSIGLLMTLMAPFSSSQHPINTRRVCVFVGSFVCVCVSVCACGWAPPLNEMLFVIIIIINRRLQPDGWPRKSAADRPWMAFVLRAAVPSVGGQKKTDQLLLWFTFNWMHFVEIKLVRLVSTRLIRRIQKFKFVGRWRWRQ